MKSCGPLIAILLLATHTPAVTVQTTDGLAITVSNDNGSITRVAVNDTDLPLLNNTPGGLAIRADILIEPSDLFHYNFDTTTEPWTSARNADWENPNPFATWLPDGGIDNSPHLLLGTATGAGMAMTAPLPIQGGSALRISWQARTATTESTQIICVRIYDDQGNDITGTANSPANWGWSTTSMAHYITPLANTEADTWEPFHVDYLVPRDAAAIRVSLRHWTGGDHLVHIDDLHLDIIGGILPSDAIPVSGPITPTTNGFIQSATIPTLNLDIETTLTAKDGYFDINIDIQDTAQPQQNRPLLLSWSLPIDTTNWKWWDDIDTFRTIAPDSQTLNNAWLHTSHTMPYYPYGAITNSDAGLCLAIPMNDPIIAHIQCDPQAGLRFVWELALSPVTTKIGPGHATTSIQLFHHDPEWGFRAATQKYQDIFPEFFTKRTRREGAWMYPIRPSQIPNPEDFGFAFLETNPMSETEHTLCDVLDIGVFYYLEPWLAWQSWGDMEDKPTQAERIARLESWAYDEVTFATRIPDGGFNDTAHLLLGDGTSTGAGMAMTDTIPVTPGDTIDISWQARTANTDTAQILCVRLFDAQDNDITSTCTTPTGWLWSGTSLAHCKVAITNTTADTWEPFTYSYPIPQGVSAMRVSLRYWNGGNFWLHIDDFSLFSQNTQSTILLMDFETEDAPWTSAQNADWDNPQPNWLRAPRQIAAQSVLNVSPRDENGNYFIDHSYLWHEWTAGNLTQAWPLNPDPDLPAPNTYTLYRENWILPYLDTNAGVYIDSVTAFAPVSGWENRRTDHHVFSDTPLTFSWADGGPSQLGPQAHAEFLTPIAEELHSQDKWMMLNLFPSGMRFHAHNADLMGSEIMQLVEADWESRLRRTLAGTRIVSNLLQYNWDSDYITFDQMEEFIRGQLFWGFYPAVSSGGGPMTAGAPDRYFLHPEMYERDRPLFIQYIPVIRLLSSAGWKPATNATASPEADIERFGDFSETSLFLTVRGHDHQALQAEVTINLADCNLDSVTWPIDLFDVLNNTAIPAVRLASPERLIFPVSLDTGEVGVYRLDRNPFAPGDYNQDGQADLDDLPFFTNCLAGPDVLYQANDPCLSGDTDADSDVDLLDFLRFQAAFENSRYRNLK